MVYINKLAMKVHCFSHHATLHFIIHVHIDVIKIGNGRSDFSIAYQALAEMSSEDVRETKA
jgi:hypothetical protein